MATDSVTVQVDDFAIRRWVLVGILALLGVIALLAAKKPLLLLAVPLAIPALYAATVRPAVFTLLALGLLYTNAPVVAIRFHGVPMMVGMAIVPLLLAVPIGHRWLFQQRPVAFDPVFQLGALFLMAQLVATVFSNDRNASMVVIRETVAEGLVLYLLVFNAVRSTAVLRQVIWVLLLTGAAIGGLCVFQYATKTYDHDYGGFAQQESIGFFTNDTSLEGQVRQPRLGGPIGEKNRFAQNMLMLVPLGLFRFWNERTPWLRGIAAAATALVSLGLMLAFSRAAAFGFVAMLGVMISLKYIRVRQSMAIVAGVAVLLLLLPQYLTRLSSLGAVINKSSEISLDEADGSIKGRLTEAMAAVYMFADRPWTGVGPGMYRYHFQHYAEIVGTDIRGAKVHEELRQPHVLYLGLAAELGLPGIVTFLLLVTVLLARLEQARRASLSAGRPDLAALPAGFLLAMICYLTTSLFLHLAYVRYFWLITALASAACAIVAHELSKAAAAQNGPPKPEH
jgi:O-antigen ligase